MFFKGMANLLIGVFIKIRLAVEISVCVILQ
jgi:hypothetical protein